MAPIEAYGKGEASCIAYAKERTAIVVTDDRTARKQDLTAFQ